ncbi:TlpA family protein disulfide reductase [Chloroflexota bacterium]
MKIARRNLSLSVLVTWVTIILVLVGTLGVAACSPSSQIPPENAKEANTHGIPTAPEVGRMAPDFTLLDMDGNEVGLSEFRGKVVLVNFWATWCPPCRAEMPDIESLYQEYKDKDVVVIGVDLREGEDKVRRFVQDGGYNWIFTMDATGKVGSEYRVRAIPTSFFLDKDGIIKAIHIGTMSKSAMEVKLAVAMNGITTITLEP